MKSTHHSRGVSRPLGATVEANYDGLVDIGRSRGILGLGDKVIQIAIPAHVDGCLSKGVWVLTQEMELSSKRGACVLTCENKMKDKLV